MAQDLPLINDVYDNNSDLISKLSVAKDLLDTAQETYFTQSNHTLEVEGRRTNAITTTLTVVATVIPTIGLIPALLGINTYVPFNAGGIDDHPVLSREYAMSLIPFLVVLLIMIVLSILGFFCFWKFGLIGNKMLMR